MTNSTVQGQLGRATMPLGGGCFHQGAGPDSLVAPGPAPEVRSLPLPGEHYSHAIHAELVERKAQETRDERYKGHVQFVQVKLGESVFCGLINRPWVTRDGQPMWSLQLRTPSGNYSDAHVPSFKVRQCSGIDGRCVCAAEAATRGAAGAAGAAEGCREVTC